VIKYYLLEFRVPCLQFKEVKILPNIKSAKKRVRVSSTKRSANMSRRSSLKTILKKTVASISAGNVSDAKTSLNLAVKQLDEAASKGLIHKNQASRRKSRLMKKLNALAQ
jgi:small subunit ribosomal protein S20